MQQANSKHSRAMKSRSQRSERGSALIFSLVILTVITITAMVAIQRSTLELRMVNSMQHSQQVFNATYDYMYQGMMYMQGNMTDTRVLLSNLITDDTSTAVSISLENVAGWTPPIAPGTVGQIGGQLRLTEDTAEIVNNGSYLKGNSGNSQGGSTTYSFVYSAAGSDTAGRISSNQEMVFSLEGPSL